MLELTILILLIINNGSSNVSSTIKISLEVVLIIIELVLLHPYY